MKIAVFPGSFNPWHDGHLDVYEKASQVFDKVIIARGINPSKPITDSSIPVTYEEFDGLLVDFCKKVGATAVIRGLRNTKDFQYELEQQYWNEDLGLDIPTLYIITDRKLCHISSSAIRMLEKFKK